MTKKKLKEVRHSNCNSLLFEGEGNCDIEIYCAPCRTMVYPLRTPQQSVSWPKGKDFLSDRSSLAHRCRNCHRLQFLSRAGEGKYEVRCKYCKRDTYYDTVLMRKGEMKYPKDAESEQNRKNLAW